MFGFLIERAITASEKRTGGDASYLRMLHRTSPAAFRKFGAVMRLAAHREAAPEEACQAARIVGVLAEDCGPCAQITVNLARAAGVADAQIEAVLCADTAAMSRDTALGYRFATAVLARSPDADPAREAVRARWGDKAIVDLSLAVQTVRMFPMLKAGMGYATACQRVQVGATNVEIAHP